MDMAIWVQAIATCVLVIVTVILVIANIGLAKATKKYADISGRIADYTKQYVEESKNYVTATHAMVDEMKKDREERIKPCVTMSLSKVVQVYVLRFANVGGSPAYGIEISCGPNIKIPVINRLYQNNEISLPIGNEEFFGRKGIGGIKVNIKYKDRAGNPYNDEAAFTLGLAKEGIETMIFRAIDDMRGSLDYISKNLPGKFLKNP